jgi:hypothetical protein
MTTAYCVNPCCIISYGQQGVTCAQMLMESSLKTSNFVTINMYTALGAADAASFLAL